MSYYASGGGRIDFKRPPTKKERDQIDDIIRYWFESAYWDADTAIDIYYDGKYHTDFEDDIQKLDGITPIADGNISFVGEDGEHWRFSFNEKTRRFEEENGRIVYDTDTPLTWDQATEFIGQIIDGFEDFLESKGIDIPNPEKAESEGPAILYGTDYGELQSYIENSLINWGLLPRINPNQTVY